MYPATIALGRALKAKAKWIQVEDDERSPTRRSGRYSSRGKKARAWALVKGGKQITPAFWSLANLESHCNRRWHKYVAKKPTRYI